MLTRALYVVPVLFAAGWLAASAAEGEGEKGPQRPPRRPEPGMIVRFALAHAEDLKLTDEQKTKLEELAARAPKPPGEGERPNRPEGKGDMPGHKDGRPGGMEGPGGKDGGGPGGREGHDGKQGPPDGKKGPPDGKREPPDDKQGPPDGKHPPGDGEGGGEKPRGPRPEKGEKREGPLMKILTEDQLAKLHELLKAEHPMGGKPGEGGGPGGEGKPHGDRKGPRPEGPPPQDKEAQ